MAHVIVETEFDRALTDDELSLIARKVDECAGARSGLWMRSYLALDRLRMVCEFEAPDAESIREAYRSAGAPFTRVWGAERYTRE
jgi:hypothetical protein